MTATHNELAAPPLVRPATRRRSVERGVVGYWATYAAFLLVAIACVVFEVWTVLG